MKVPLTRLSSGTNRTTTLCRWWTISFNVSNPSEHHGMDHRSVADTFEKLGKNVLIINHRPLGSFECMLFFRKQSNLEKT